MADNYTNYDGLLYFWQKIKSAFVAKDGSKVLSTNDYTTAEKNKLSGIADNAQVNVIETVKVNNTALSVSGKAVNIDLSSYALKSDVASAVTYKGSVASYSKLPTSGQTVGDMYNVEAADASHDIKAGDNVVWNGTAWDNFGGMIDLSGYATTSALDNKVDKVSGKGLSTNDFTAALKTKLDGISTGAQVNVLEGVQTNGTDLTITNKKVNIPVMGGASSSAAGSIGLVPAPAKGDQAKFLRADGTYQTPTNTNTTYTLTQDATDGHKITLTPSSGTAQTITIPDNNTTYSAATQSAPGLMSADDKKKLDGIATGAQVNAVTSVNSKTGAVTLAKGDVGLGNVDNTADANKSVASAAKLTTARQIDGVSFDGSANIIHFGECSTVAATVAKVVACTGFTLAKGAWIAVKFTVTNTGAVASLTLNVNNTGAKSIKYRGGNLPAVGTLTAGRVYFFVYDGTNYELIGDLDTNTTYSSMSASEATTGTATSERSISAKVLNDKIVEKIGTELVAITNSEIDTICAS